MLWKPFVAAALFTLSAPAFADEKGAALVQGWIAQIPDILPVTAEMTTTYKIGRWTAVYKNRVSLASDGSWSFRSPYRFDDEYPIGLFNDALGDHLTPLPHHGDTGHLGITPSDLVGHTTYLGKETINGTTFDVVEVRENLQLHFSPPSPMLTSLRSREDNRISIKWYLDPEGIPRRMTFAAKVQVPDPYVSFGSGFDAPAAPAGLAGNPRTPAGPKPPATEIFTAKMVVESLRKARKLPARAGLSDPLYKVPDSSHGNCIFSPDSKLLAVYRPDKLQVVLTGSGAPKYKFEGINRLTRFCFSPDGKSLAFADAAGVSVLRTEDGKLVKRLDTAHSYLNSISLSPEANWIALVTERYEVEIWSVETGRLERTLTESRQTNGAIFSADGRRLVTTGMNTDIRIWDTSTWEIVGRLPNRTFSPAPIALSRDGRKIAAVNADNDVLLWDGPGSPPVKKLKGPAGRIRFLTFSFDGTSLYAGDTDEISDAPSGAPGLVAWDIASGSITADRSPWRTDIMSGAYHGVVSPDGRFAAFPGPPNSSGSVAIFALQAGK